MAYPAIAVPEVRPLTDLHACATDQVRWKPGALVELPLGHVQEGVKAVDAPTALSCLRANVLSPRHANPVSHKFEPARLEARSASLSRDSPSLHGLACCYPLRTRSQAARCHPRIQSFKGATLSGGVSIASWATEPRRTCKPSAAQSRYLLYSERASARIWCEKGLLDSADSGWRIYVRSRGE